jgi:hypothetical protein
MSFSSGRKFTDPLPTLASRQTGRSRENSNSKSGRTPVRRHDAIRQIACPRPPARQTSRRRCGGQPSGSLPSSFAYDVSFKILSCDHRTYPKSIEAAEIPV